ncbi:MAG: hypothetical protein IKK86_04790 [Alistipes sp.]|nr:hypothetical protein [Alistipes sp.]MBR3773727.1 hypothetical protein [Alistipes sp.]
MQKTLTLLLLLLLSSTLLANPDGDTPPPPKKVYVEIKDNAQPGPRGLVDVVAVATISGSVVTVTFIEPLGDVTLTLSNWSGELDYAVSNTANGSVLMMLPADASGEIAITITDAAGDQYVGEFAL